MAATTFLSDPSSGCDTAQQDPDGEDDNGHGTHVAGIAAASGRYGVSGVAPGASLVVAKVLDCAGSGEYGDVVSDIDWAVQQGAKVINLSLGDASIGGLVDTSSIEGSPLGQALQDAWNNGVVPVIAAGNNSDGLLGLGDANYAGVPAIVVAATGAPSNGETDELSYSNGVNDAEWGLAAPGGDDPNGPSTPTCGDDDEYEILSTYWMASPPAPYNATDCDATDEGTSTATPFVTGTVALLLGRGLSPTQVVQTLRSTADHSVSCGSDCSGLLDAAAAMQAAAAMTTRATSSAREAGPEHDHDAGARRLLRRCRFDRRRCRRIDVHDRAPHRHDQHELGGPAPRGRRRKAERHGGGWEKRLVGGARGGGGPGGGRCPRVGGAPAASASPGRRPLREPGEGGGLATRLQRRPPRIRLRGGRRLPRHLTVQGRHLVAQGTPHPAGSCAGF